MKKSKRLIQLLVVVACAVILSVIVPMMSKDVVRIDDEKIALSDGPGNLIVPTKDDNEIIPDKYNTGVVGDLATVGLADTVNGIVLASGSNGTSNVLDFYYKNSQIVGTIKFENYDFSGFPLVVYNTDKIDRKINIVFENCKFGSVSTAKESGSISYQFNNCTIKSFNGSNAIFNACMFGKSYSDGLVPFQDVVVNDSFFCDMARDDAKGAGLHTDGTQIYGAKGIDVKNIHFDNCRFELPTIILKGDAAYVNACIMLQLEYSNAENVSFTNCKVNGGGCTIFARSVNDAYSFKNVIFKNIEVGKASRYGAFYNDLSQEVVFENIGQAERLYVGSIWKENGETHISVTNDTGVERKLIVVTNDEQHEYTIAACPVASQLNSYDEFPFDIDICIPYDCEYVVCYDATLENGAEQIRFTNWGANNVYVSNKINNSTSVTEYAVLCEGVCGKEVSYKLTADGVLTLSGTGSTYNYNSAKPAPWVDFLPYIKEIKIEEGIEELGTQIFKNCSGIRTISFPNGLTKIGSRGLSGCAFLEEVRIPNTVECIETSSFEGAIIQKTYYEGSMDKWTSIVIEGGNENLVGKLIIEEKETVQSPVVTEREVLLQGMCGKNVYYKMFSDGVLQIYGEGSTYNYNSIKTAPWYDYKECLKEIVIEEGVTNIGQQMFRNCKNLHTACLAQSIVEIGSNAFIGCGKLSVIEVPQNIKKIGQFAFDGTGLTETVYAGTQENWLNIQIAGRNAPLLKNVIFIN